MIQWLPMETVPEDAGEVHLLLDDVGGEQRKVIAHWSQGSWWVLAEDGAFKLKNERLLGWSPTGRAAAPPEPIPRKADPAQPKLNQAPGGVRSGAIIASWLPIETAPTDGRSVVLLSGANGNVPTPAMWFVSEWRTLAGEPVRRELLGWAPVAEDGELPATTNLE